MLRTAFWMWLDLPRPWLAGSDLQRRNKFRGKGALLRLVLSIPVSEHHMGRSPPGKNVADCMAQFMSGPLHAVQRTLHRRQWLFIPAATCIVLWLACRTLYSKASARHLTMQRFPRTRQRTSTVARFDLFVDGAATGSGNGDLDGTADGVGGSCVPALPTFKHTTFSKSGANFTNAKLGFCVRAPPSAPLLDARRAGMHHAGLTSDCLLGTLTCVRMASSA